MNFHQTCDGDFWRTPLFFSRTERCKTLEYSTLTQQENTKNSRARTISENEGILNPALLDSMKAGFFQIHLQLKKWKNPRASFKFTWKKKHHGERIPASKPYKTPFWSWQNSHASIPRPGSSLHRIGLQVDLMGKRRWGGISFPNLSRLGDIPGWETQPKSGVTNIPTFC